MARQDIQEVGEGRKEGRGKAGRREAVKAEQGGPKSPRRAQGREAEATLRRQPADREGLRRRPVQAYIAAMPGWKRDVGRRLDAIITRTVPGVRKAVKWNSPLYGVEDEASGSSAFIASRST